MSNWITPKTDWYGTTVSDGAYQGDRFNAVDFNRIKNNLAYLKELSLQMYEDYAFNDVGQDKTVRDYFYADEINAMEENLNSINAHTVKQSYGASPEYNENGLTMDWTELNRLESATLDIYNRLISQREGRRMFTWNFGMKGGDF